MNKKLTAILAAMLVVAIGFAVFTNNTTAHAQTRTSGVLGRAASGASDQQQEEMQMQIDELRELVNLLVLALSGNNQQGQNTQAGVPGVSSQRARDIATEFIGNGTARDVLLFTENNVLMFEVEVHQENVRYNVYINAVNGDVIRMNRHEEGVQDIATLPEVITPTPSPSPSPTPQPRPQPSPSPSPGNVRGNRPTNPAISLERAIEIAQADLTRRGISATLRGNSGMDWERGQWVWEIEFRPTTGRGEIEYYINVQTGAIVKFEWDR
jgi:uncharacterized membrane protein YkoI